MPKPHVDGFLLGLEHIAAAAERMNLKVERIEVRLDRSDYNKVAVQAADHHGNAIRQRWPAEAGAERSFQWLDTKIKVTCHED